MEPGFGRPVPNHTTIEHRVPSRLAFLKPPWGGLEKLPEVTRSSSSLLAKIGRVGEASGTVWRPGLGEIHTLFKEGEPTQDNCRANRQRKPRVSLEVPLMLK
jgi:hypothetical protein